MESIIKIKNLKKYYGEVKAVNGISMEIYKGEMFGLVGPDGAGKTTTIRDLMRIIKPYFRKSLHFDKNIKKHEKKFKIRLDIFRKNLAYTVI